MRIMNIKHGSCCDLVEQKVNFWFTNSGELVIESEILNRLYDYFEPTSVKSRVVRANMRWKHYETICHKDRT